jgi:hypothetical protein
MTSRLRLIAISALVLSGSARAADIGPAKSARGEPLAAIMIEGEITKGDYAKFANVFIDNRDRNYAVILRSPGGDFSEALKIGRLIHALKLTTNAPDKSNFEMYELNNPSNKVCASSCFFLFAAGAKRFGEIVGIHRPYLPKSAYRELNMDQAGQANTIVRRMVESYLKEIDAPAIYVDRIMAVDSGEIEWLTSKELKQHFNGYAPAYQEWMVAKCVPPSAANNERLIRVIKGIPVSDGNFTATDSEIIQKYFDCSYTIQKKETDRLWAIMFARRLESKASHNGSGTKTDN